MKADIWQNIHRTATIETELFKNQNRKSLNAPVDTGNNMQYWFKDR